MKAYRFDNRFGPKPLGIEGMIIDTNYLKLVSDDRLDVSDNDIHYAVTIWINAEVLNIRNMKVFIQQKIKSMVHSWVQILETQKTLQAPSNTLG